MATLSLTTNEVTKALCMVAGVGRDPADLDTQTQSDFRAMIRAGLRLFFNPPGGHQWRFLERPFPFAASDPYETGTITVSAGTITLASGTWPSWAADGIVRVDGQTLIVTARTSDSVLTTEHTGISVDAGTSYELHRWRTGLPTDFGEFIGGVVYQRSNCAERLQGLDDTAIRLRHSANFRTGLTKAYAVVPGRSTDASDWYLTFWPTMDSESMLAGIYRALPEDNLDASDLTTDDSFVQIAQVHSGTLLAAILSCAEEYYNDANGVHSQKFQRLLAASIAYDKLTPGPVHTSMSPHDARRYSLLYHTPTYNDLL